MNWFEADKDGLKKLLEVRGKSFALFELISNAFDADGVTTVNVSLEYVPYSPTANLVIEDDSPVGFQNLSHAWTLFAESNRKGDVSKRGRFNLGEKLVLAICRKAVISSTTGTVVFNEDGRKTLPRKKRERGSSFSAWVEMNRKEVDEAIKAIHSIIVPDGITLTVNDVQVKRQASRLKTIDVNLPTEFADAEGILRRTRRNTKVEIWHVPQGEQAMIFEMGIPVVETGDKYHVNVLQKVPLNMNRDNVTPAYLQEIRTAVLNATVTTLAPSEVTAPWVRNALEDASVAPEAVETVLTKQFGDKRVVYDPSDPEGTKIAVSKGYTVIPSNTFSKDAWANIRESKAVLPAGQVTPSPKPFTPGGQPLQYIDPASYTPTMKNYISFAQWLAKELLDVDLSVKLTKDVRWGTVACYGDCELIVNASKTSLVDSETVLRLLIHEFSHERVSDHLSNEFHEECCRLGAKLTRLAFENRAGFEKHAMI